MIIVYRHISQPKSLGVACRQKMSYYAVITERCYAEGRKYFTARQAAEAYATSLDIDSFVEEIRLVTPVVYALYTERWYGEDRQYYTNKDDALAHQALLSIDSVVESWEVATNTVEYC